ncbi:Hypothetical protein NTJ_13342 [Nesidiocoris tenuis]|uniref:Uncharacterized protein n=1 Tax=Nesidiocoris tenuis TaxID=355587 RepID=A0ABN7B842_9HEMI|nr:Hypothetical protein NTJ_13342 [Nesidiocoris tenuis]
MGFGHPRIETSARRSAMGVKLASRAARTEREPIEPRVGTPAALCATSAPNGSPLNYYSVAMTSSVAILLKIHKKWRLEPVFSNSGLVWFLWETPQF